MGQKSNKRPWRKLVKKLQRKRRRQARAKKRQTELEKAELEKLKDPLYKSWMEQQDVLKIQQQLKEENERQHQEEQWLRRELLAQQQFKREELKRQAEEDKLVAERLRQEQELKQFEENRLKKQEELKLQAEKAAKEFEDVMTCMQTYLDDSTMKTPSRLECFVQTRPGEKSCDFFDKTNCCRFGAGCSFNHKKPLLAKIILIKHFFQHPLLEHQEHEEYDRSDSQLELSERDLRDSYDEFCEDVWPVLEEFGSIVNFRTVRNVQAHLRGHVFVEYEEKRSALKAFINLQNRYYASKRLNVQFSNIRQWRTGVCGLSLGRKCPKGVKCNFLHLMQNMDNKYNKPIENPDRTTRRGTQSAKIDRETPYISWNTEDCHKTLKSHTRNWRWSESPEIELKSNNAQENFKEENLNTEYKNTKRRKSCSPSSRDNNTSSIRSRSKSHKTKHYTSYRKPRSKSPFPSSNKNARKSRSSSPRSSHVKICTKSPLNCNHSRQHHKKESPSITKHRSHKRRDKSP